ncbi:uncharacterized protein CTRU02_206853 [Colletotrichum truncatum]|uniref:Uncharacterized protein n=1 Tax=Colletotrichum truncatum TaxID=5467 RepID=A0ACC3YZ01_COLTU
MRVPSLLGVISTLPFLFGMAEAGCNEVGHGEGNNPLRCKSYSIPKDIGSKTTVGLQTLSIERTSPPPIFEPIWTYYDFHNIVNYQVNFAVQWWNPVTKAVCLMTQIFQPSTDTPDQTELVGEL